MKIMIVIDDSEHPVDDMTIVTLGWENALGEPMTETHHIHECRELALRKAAEMLEEMGLLGRRTHTQLPLPKIEHKGE